MRNLAAKVRLFFDIYNNYKLFCKNSLKSLCMCIFFCTFARCIVMGPMQLTLILLLTTMVVNYKLSIKVNSRIDFVFAQKNAVTALVSKTKKRDIDKRQLLTTKLT